MPARRPAALLAVAGLAAGAVHAAPGPAGPVAQRTKAVLAVEARTSLGLFPEVLAPLGVEVEVVGGAPMAHHPLSVSAPGDASFPATGEGLAARLDGRRLAGWTGGGLRHRGGVVLRRGDATLDLDGFVLRNVTPPGERTALAAALVVTDAAGVALFTVRLPHHELADDGTLRVFNGDLALTAEGAARLGLPRHEGFVVGVLESAVRLLPGAVPEKGGGPPPACTDWSGDVDVALTSVGGVQWTGVESPDGRIVVAGSALLKNVGTANVPWYSKFSGSFPPYGNDQHPFLVWAMYRIRPDGVFEQMARSQLKHAFMTVNDKCDPSSCTQSPSHVLGPGCEDLYSFVTNIDDRALAPRGEVDPFTGVWAHCDEPSPGTPSHFDQDGNCVVDHTGIGEDSFVHGMAVRTAELAAGDRFFFESWYVVRADVDIFNSMGRLEVSPSTDGTSWFFAPVGLYDLGPAVDAWVDPASPPAGTANEKVASIDGHAQLAVRTTAAGGGVHRYVYALQNHDVTAGLDRFDVALPPGAAVSAVAMTDTDEDAGNDWVASVTPAGVRFTAPAGNELPWGGLFAFVVEVDVAPAAGTAAAGIVGCDAVALPTLTPGGASDTGWIFSDGFETGDASRWTL